MEWDLLIHGAHTSHTTQKQLEPHPPLTPAQADFRALATWEPQGLAEGGAEGKEGGKRRLDLEIVGGMCRHLAGLRGA